MSLTVKTVSCLYPDSNYNYPHVTNGGRDFQSRSIQLLNSIKEGDADVICLQEVDGGFFNYVKQNLSGYTAYFAEHGAEPDGVAIFYKKQFQHLKVETSSTNHATNPLKNRTTTERKDLYCDFKEPSGEVTRFATFDLEDYNGFDGSRGKTQLEEIRKNVEAQYPGQTYKVNRILLGGVFNDSRVVKPNGSRLDDLRKNGYILNPIRGGVIDANGKMINDAIAHVGLKVLDNKHYTISTDDPFKYQNPAESDQAPVTVRITPQSSSLGTVAKVCVGLFAVAMGYYLFG